MSDQNLRSGLLLVDKPAGMTSADVLNQLKRKHRFARIGHGGTLDPFATGLMVALLGEGTKIARFLLEGEKTYEADASLGVETDTGDLTGKEVGRENVPTRSLEEWQTLADKFLGRSKQIPPMYSAIKVKGKALYEYARKGQEVEVKAREIEVTELAVLEVGAESLRFRVRSSGGTYIRVLAADLARSGGTRAHLRALRRLASSSFRVENAITLEAALEAETTALPVLPLVKALGHLPVVRCERGHAERVRQGNLTAFDSLRSQIEKPGYFLLVEGEKPVAVCNHHPMLVPFCSIERVFDPRLVET